MGSDCISSWSLLIFLLFWHVLGVIYAFGFCQSINIQALTDWTDQFCTWRVTWRSEPMTTQRNHPRACNGKNLQWLTSLSSNQFLGPLFQIWKQRYAVKIHSRLFPLISTATNSGNSWTNMLKIIFRNKEHDVNGLGLGGKHCLSQKWPAHPLGTPTDREFWISHQTGCYW